MVSGQDCHLIDAGQAPSIHREPDRSKTVRPPINDISQKNQVAWPTIPRAVRDHLQDGREGR